MPVPRGTLRAKILNLPHFLQPGIGEPLAVVTVLKIFFGLPLLDSAMSFCLGEPHVLSPCLSRLERGCCGIASSMEVLRFSAPFFEMRGDGEVDG